MTDVLADGGTALVPALQAAATPKAACFYVYPTVDPAIRTGLHTTFTDVSAQVDTTAAQAARLRSICSLYVPLYRQATLGTYGKEADPTRGACFDVAFGDVSAAFEQFLSEIPPTQPIVLLGHSQGAQNVSRLLRARFDDGGALAKRLVVGLPIGWHTATATASTSGASFQKLPLCERATQTGCVLTWRTYGAGNQLPDFNPELVEGPKMACTNPAGDGPGPFRLKGAVFPVTHATVSVPPRLAIKTPFARYPDYFTARCVWEGSNSGLEIAAAPNPGDPRVSPIDFDKLLLSGTLGTHVLDLQLPQDDVLETVRRRVEAFVP